MAQGSLKSGANTVAISNAKLRADQFSFSAGGATYAGRVNGNTIEGTVTTGGNATKWSATRH
ncbi:MAG: hypothetical protein NTW47_12980 [Proteobacteria bacterium]|nr:hypothetical protein [Pseudomonadota bacterium]